MPCERCALSSEKHLSAPGASWALGFPDRAGWLGVPPDQGSPCPSSSHRGRAGWGARGPWRLLPAVQAVRTEETWVSSGQTDHRVCQRLGLPVTRLSHQRPLSKGNSLFLKAWRLPHDSPSVFLRRPFQLRASRTRPSLCEPRLGVCFLLCPPIKQVPGGPHQGWGHQALEMLHGGCQPLLPAGLRFPETHLFFNWRIVTLQYGAGFCHTSAWITCPPSRTSLPSRLSQTPCVSSLGHTAHSPVVCFTRAGVCVSMLLSAFVQPSPSALGPQVCSF